MMPTETFIEITYFIATILFILSLKWLSSPTTARRGVIAGEVGMALAIGPMPRPVPAAVPMPMRHVGGGAVQQCAERPFERQFAGAGDQASDEAHRGLV